MHISVVVKNQFNRTCVELIVHWETIGKLSRSFVCTNHRFAGQQTYLSI